MLYTLEKCKRIKQTLNVKKFFTFSLHLVYKQKKNVF